MTSSETPGSSVATISVAEVVGSPFCVASEDGQVLHRQIAEKIEAGFSVSLSFSGVQRLTTAFLNAAIGQLYNEFSEETIKTQLSVIETESRQLTLLKKVVDTAKAYFKNKELFTSATKGVTGDDDA